MQLETALEVVAQELNDRGAASLGIVAQSDP